MALASQKALKARGYDVEEDYVVDSADPKNIDEQFIPDNESGNSGEDYNFLENVIATGYNIPKTVADYALQTLPMAETVLNPIGEYSGIYDYFKNLGSTDLENTDFIKISKSQRNNPEISDYLEGYKQEFILDETKVVDHLNKNLGLDVISVEDLVSKYKGNKEVADAVSSSVKEIEKDYFTQDDRYEDEDFYYI